MSVTAPPPGQVSRMSVTTAAYMGRATVPKDGRDTVTKAPAALRASMFTLNNSEIPPSPPGSFTTSSPSTPPPLSSKIDENDTHVELPDSSPLLEMMDVMRPSIASTASSNLEFIKSASKPRQHDVISRESRIDVTLADDEMAMPPGQVRQMSVSTKAYIEQGKAPSEKTATRGSILKPPATIRASMFTPGLTSPDDLDVTGPPGNL